MIDLLHLLATGILLAGTVIMPIGELPTLAPEPGGGEETPVPEGGEEEVAEGEEAIEGEEGEQEEIQEGEKPREGQPDWKVVPPEVKAHIQEIGKTNSKLANLLQNAVYTSQSMLRVFPGGLKEAQNLKKSIEDVGGIEEIQNLTSTYKALQDEQENLDNLARKGDVSVLDNLVNIAGDGFTKLMPAALEKWNAADSQDYSHTMSKIMVEAMTNGGVIADINLAYKMLGMGSKEATAVAIESLNKASKWINNVGRLAANAPRKPQVDPTIAKQQEEVNNEQTKIFNDKFGMQFAPWRDGEIRRQLMTLAPKGRKFTDYQMETYGARVVDEVKNILTADHDYVKDLERIYGTRNMTELLKFTKSRTSKHLPDVCKMVYGKLFRDLTSKVKPGAKPGVKPEVKPNGQATPAPKEWTKVTADKAPTPDEIDNGKTDFKMKYRRQAILKNGMKVYWGDKIPQ